jgi:uncharacterized membrane protein
MIKTQTSIVIERSAAEVWAYAADIVRHPAWMSVRDAIVLRGDGSSVGSRGRERLILGPLSLDVEFEVTEAVPGHRIVWRSVMGPPFGLEVTLDLDPSGPTSTRATYGARIQPRGLWRLLSPLMAMEGKAGPERELRRLKGNVEKPAEPVAAMAQDRAS